MTGDELIKMDIDHPNWQQLYDFAHKMEFGSVTITFKDSVPVRIDNPMQSIIFKL